MMYGFQIIKQTALWMKTSIVPLVILLMLTADFPALAQESRIPAGADSDIYISQQKSDAVEFPENRAELNEALVMKDNEIRAIALYYPEQEVLLEASFLENSQWNPDSTDFSFPTVSDSVSTFENSSESRLAEFLSEAMTGNREDSRSEISPESDEMEAFRKAFEAVLKEEVSGEDLEERPVFYEDVDGMVLDETRSKTGRDFYNAFYAAWSNPEGATNYIIRISEKPGPGMGHIVFIEIDYDEVFELRLRPGDHRMKQAGDVAVARARDYLKERPENTSIY